MKPLLYDAAVASIQQRNPGEVLLPTLLKGHSIINEVYLRAALRRLPTATTADTQPDRAPVDVVLRGLWRQRTMLFGEMNKRSNHFHACKSDDERAANSREIRRIWGEILNVKASIDYYEQHGHLPDPVSEERFPLPENPVDILKKLNSIRAQISQVKKRLDDLVTLPESHPDRLKIGDAEARLNELKLYAGHAKTALERKNLLAG